jgi:hypothetical protein
VSGDPDAAMKISPVGARWAQAAPTAHLVLARHYATTKKELSDEVGEGRGQSCFEVTTVLVGGVVIVRGMRQGGALFAHRSM